MAPSIVPGLLQIEGYARAMIGLVDGRSQAEIDSWVDVRMERQAVTKKWRPPTFTYFLCESALRCPIGGNPVMNEQMLHLAFLAGRPQMTIRVVPFSAAAYASAMGEFTFMDFADHGRVVYLVNMLAGLFVESAEDVAVTRANLERVAWDALSEEESLEFLAQVARAYDRQPDEGAQ